MILDKFEHTKLIEIWSPRFHDKRVLIGKYHLDHKLQPFKIIFTDKRKDGTVRYPETYYLSRKTIKRHKLESNGTIMCYSVPFDKLEKLIINERSEASWK
jgi:hypothetical protein